MYESCRSVRMMDRPDQSLADGVRIARVLVMNYRGKITMVKAWSDRSSDCGLTESPAK